MQFSTWVSVLSLSANGA